MALSQECGADSSTDYAIFQVQSDAFASQLALESFKQWDTDLNYFLDFCQIFRHLKNLHGAVSADHAGPSRILSCGGHFFSNLPVKILQAPFLCWVGLPPLRGINLLLFHVSMPGWISLGIF